MRYFNTAGPTQSDIHYILPPLKRWNLAEIESLILQRKYFVLHAPRQTGKTSCMLALMEHLNQSSDYYCLYINVEAAQAARENVAAAIMIITAEIAKAARRHLNDDWPQTFYAQLSEINAPSALGYCLDGWCQRLDKPLVLLIDEIDSLVGDTLISVLRQLRAGYSNRPAAFPQTVLLCGVRDVRDYRLRLGDGKEVITGGSAFNIKAESLLLGNFS
ncbi:MAG: AAA-like domain-containing protein, partial [Mariprofundales bacterium]